MTKWRAAGVGTDSVNMGKTPGKMISWRFGATMTNQLAQIPSHDSEDSLKSGVLPAGNESFVAPASRRHELQSPCDAPVPARRRRYEKLHDRVACARNANSFLIRIAHFRLTVLAMILASTLLLSSVATAQSTGPSTPKQKAIEDLKQIAYAGDSSAQVQLGVIYLTGDGVAKDDAEAVKWLRKAAEQDSALAERYLAEMYFKGRGVPADNTEAAKWLRQAAEQGDAKSQHNLAVLYIQGSGVPRNSKEAANWMRKAADQSLAEGQQGLGILYESGDGVPEDPIEAAKWYRKAVDQNYVPAMNSLASLMASTKEPSVRNPPAAVEMAMKAVAKGNNPDYLDTLAAAYFANGQTDKAVETEEKALTRDPENETYKKAFQKYSAAAHGSR